MSPGESAHDLTTVAKFALHTAAGVALFVLIGATAAGLAYFTDLLTQLKISPLIINGMHAAEYFLFAADMLCFVVYVSREAFVLITSMLPGRGKPTDLPK